MKKKTLETIKIVGQIIVGIGITTIVGGVVKENTSEEEGAMKKLCIWAGGLVLGSMLCSKADEYLTSKFDQVVEKSKGLMEETEETN